MSRTEAFSGRRIDIMCAIAASCKARGYSPTSRELGEMLGISLSTAASHVEILERAGLVTRGIKSTRPTWRSLKLTPAGEALIGQRKPETFSAERAVEHLDLGA